MEDDIQKTALRLPRDLHRKVHEAAAASGRSMNAEIVARLQASFADEERGIPGSTRMEGITVNAFEEALEKMQQRFQSSLDIIKREAAELERLKAQVADSGKS